MSKFMLKKTFFSIALIPILAAPLILTSCFNTAQVQFPPAVISLNDNLVITNLITDLDDATNKPLPAVLNYANGTFNLDNVSPISAAQPEGDYISNEKWDDFSKLHTKNILSSLLVGSGSNIDGAYTTIQLLRALFLNPTMLSTDEGYKTMEIQDKNNWDDFMLLIANSLNQSSGSFVDPKDQYLFDISNLEIIIGPKPIPFIGPLPSIASGDAALNSELYNTQIDLTITGMNFKFFNFDGDAIQPPPVDSSQFKLLKKIGFNANTIASEFKMTLKSPIKFSVKQIIYDSDAWTDRENTFPEPLPVGPFTREGKAIFIGIIINEKKMYNALNINVIKAINSAQNELRKSQSIVARNSFVPAADILANNYQVDSPTTSIFILLP